MRRGWLILLTVLMLVSLPALVFLVLMPWGYPIDYILYPHDSFHVTISANGNYIAAIGSPPDGYFNNESVSKLYLFSSADNNPLWTYDGISSASISSDGSRIAAVGNYNLYLLSSTDNTPIWTYDGISSASVSPNGSHVIAIGGNKLYLFLSIDNSPIWTYDGISSASIAPDGNYIIGVGNDKLYLFSVSDNVPLWTYDGISSASIFSTESIIATSDNKLYVFSVSNNVPRFILEEIHSVVLSENENYRVVIKNGMLDVFSDNELIWTRDRIHSVSIYTDYVHLISESSLSVYSDGRIEQSWENRVVDGWTSRGMAALLLERTILISGGKLEMFDERWGDNLLTDVWEGVSDITLSIPGWGPIVASPNGEYIVAIDGYDFYLLTPNNQLWKFKENVREAWAPAFPGLVGVQSTLEGATASNNGNVVVNSNDRLYLFNRDENIPDWWRSFSGGIWEGREVIHTFQHVTMSQDGLYIAGVTMEHLHLFSSTSADPLWSYRGNFEVYGYDRYPRGFKEILRSVAISSDGSYIAGSSEGGPRPNVWGTIYLFSKDGNTPLWSYHHEVERYPRI